MEEMDFPPLSPTLYGNKRDLHANAKKTEKKEDVVRSYAKVVTSAIVPLVLGAPIALREATYEDGVAVISITEEEVIELQEPFKWCLIARFNRVRADLGNFKLWFKQSIQLSSEVFVSPLDSRHILLRFETEEDCMRTYARGDIRFKEEWVGIMRWSPYFRPNLRTSEFPVKVGLPGLNLHLRNQGVIQSIAKALGGRFLMMEIMEQNSNFVRFSMEIDLLKARPDSIIIQNGLQRFTQKIIYENVPKFCDHCCLRGHLRSNCRDLTKNKVDPQPKVRFEYRKKETKGKGIDVHQEEDVSLEKVVDSVLAHETIVSKAKDKGKEVMEVLEASDDEHEERLRFKNKLGEIVVSSWPKENFIENLGKENEDLGAASMAFGQPKENQIQVLLGDDALVDTFLNSVIASAADSLINDLADEALKTERVEVHSKDKPRADSSVERSVADFSSKKSAAIGENVNAQPRSFDAHKSIADLGVAADSLKGINFGDLLAVDSTQEFSATDSPIAKEKNKIKSPEVEDNFLLGFWDLPKEWFKVDETWEKGMVQLKKMKFSQEWDCKQSAFLLLRSTRRKLKQRCKRGMYSKRIVEAMMTELESKRIQRTKEWNEGFTSLKMKDKVEAEFPKDVDSCFSDSEVFQVRRNQTKDEVDKLKENKARKSQFWVGEDGKVRWKRDVRHLRGRNDERGIRSGSWTEDERLYFWERFPRGNIHKALLIKRTIDAKDKGEKIQTRATKYKHYFEFSHYA